MCNGPVPVQSCWNGMVVFDAAPFYRAAPPLTFRAIPTSLAQLHVEASECCLIHADNPLSDTSGVFVNPAVRVGYGTSAYDAAQRLLSVAAAITGVSHNRVRRWFTTALRRDWVVAPRVRDWEAKGGREAGAFCLVDEMQVLTDEGCTHV